MEDHWDADDWENWLQNNQSKAVMILGEEFRIHNFQWDEGKLTFLMSNQFGYDYDGSRAALEEFADNEGPYKIVDKADVFEEGGALAEGDYDSVEEWADNMEVGDEVEDEG